MYFLTIPWNPVPCIVSLSLGYSKKVLGLPTSPEHDNLAWNFVTIGFQSTLWIILKDEWVDSWHSEQVCCFWWQALPRTNLGAPYVDNGYYSIARKTRMFPLQFTCQVKHIGASSTTIFMENKALFSHAPCSKASHDTYTTTKKKYLRSNRQVCCVLKRGSTSERVPKVHQWNHFTLEATLLCCAAFKVPPVTSPRSD